MGFETSIRTISASSFLIWSIPMGFETSETTKVWVTQGDLKYPYGIWNYVQREAITTVVHLKYPYGIWNSEMQAGNINKNEFEVSLWDLKQTKAFFGYVMDNIWSIPMGFET